MSTEFVSTVTSELGFVRWFGGRERGVCYEFGTVSNWETVVDWVTSGDSFRSIDGYQCDTDPVTADDFQDLVVAGRATFGEFCVTVEVGSGELSRFTVEE